MAVRFQGGKAVPVTSVRFTKPMPSRPDILSILQSLGMFVGPSSESQAIADKLLQKIVIVRGFLNDGYPQLAQKEKENTVFGPKLRAIVDTYTQQA